MMSPELSAQYDKIYKYCYFKTGDTVLAEDLTQETFLRFYKAGKYNETGRVMAYLYTIAKNLIKDSYRKPSPSLEPMDENTAAPSQDMDTTLAVRQAVESLGDEEREVIILLVINGQSVSETAEIMGISRFSVYRTEKRALKKLRNILGGDFYG